MSMTIMNKKLFWAIGDFDSFLGKMLILKKQTSCKTVNDHLDILIVFKDSFNDS